MLPRWPALLALSSQFTECLRSSLQLTAAQNIGPQTWVCSSSGLCSAGWWQLTWLHIQIHSNLNLSFKYVASINSLKFELIYGFCIITFVQLPLLVQCGAWSEVMQQRRAQTFTGEIIIYDAIISDNPQFTVAKISLSLPHSRVCNPDNQERPFLPQLRWLVSHHWKAAAH